MSQYYNRKRPVKKFPYPPKKDCIKIEGGATSNCENTIVPIAGLTTGAVAKIPVVLAEFTVQIDVDSIVKLPEDALEIKRIKKRLMVTQCLLIQDTNKLFIKGVVRKNIEYATAGKCSNSQGVCGDIRHCTIDVPFQCVTPINFNGIEPLPVVNSTSNEFQYFSEQDLKAPEFANKDKLLSGDFSEFNQNSTEYYNELPFCELVSSRIIEFDEFLNRRTPVNSKIPFAEKVFDEIEEKMVIFLTLKLLQNRQVVIGAVAPRPCRK
ncbi:conserved hypothetical protein [Alkaliphilus metalliredigens QYMF]|uniref:SipL SPOCS domain-containing protein n=1 Tax=Alkaliphilus metalliredigens (strain QYMF) TaxID=293826 RepID=A6TTP5_ALKMQ|nr:hypothetical protein [Alkaliphilus metalliredigens]ABR49563.1 conserved hypothetical protein [Alkaliphilus metalliredigens QYMF]